MGGPTHKHAAKPVGQQTRSGKTSGPHKNCGKTSGQQNTRDKTSGPPKKKAATPVGPTNQWATNTSGNTSGHKTKVARPARSKPTSGKTSEGQNLPAVCVFGTIDYRTIDYRATYKYKIRILHIIRIPYHKSSHCAIIDC